MVSHGETAAGGAKNAFNSAADWLEEPVSSRDIALIEEAVTGLHISALQAIDGAKNFARTASGTLSDPRGLPVARHSDIIGRCAQNLPDVVSSNLAKWLEMDSLDVAKQLRLFNTSSILHEVTGVTALRLVQDLFDKTLNDQPGGTTIWRQTPVPLRVVRVLKVTNPIVAAEYKHQREVLSSISADVRKIDVRTDKAVMPGFAEPLDASLNEKLLFHGASSEVAEAILVTRAETRKPGLDGSGAFYGQGAYFAESVTKADELARPGADGLRPIIISRVSLGRVKTIYDQPGNPETLASQCSSGGFYDAICGDRRTSHASCSNYREFIMYNARRSMPCYLVWYHRGGR
jgi:hypothetical protein